MNHDHPFDALAKAVAGGLSRRALLLRVGRGLLGSLAAATGLAGLALPVQANSTALSPESPARTGRPDLALFLACREVCGERDAAYAGFCERIYQEDQAMLKQRHQSCRDGCRSAHQSPVRCEAACDSMRAELQERVETSRRGCVDRRSGRNSACLQSCGG